MAFAFYICSLLPLLYTDAVGAAAAVIAAAAVEATATAEASADAITADAITAAAAEAALQYLQGAGIRTLDSATADSFATNVVIVAYAFTRFCTAFPIIKY